MNNSHWVTTLEHAAAETPVLLLDNPHSYGRASVVLLTDEQRHLWRHALMMAERRRALGDSEHPRRRWTDKKVAIIAGVVTALVGLSDLALNITLITHGVK